ncbi:aminoacyl-tRNA deacylase [Nesterenkonia xinjiangensis]|uniref:Cys-tRNA(Pro) deacylase n=1 Tax=Nesterenkonia xinjiangensis TaxID=225327 RepID=A0A7Z0KCQ4_9MICC|nr:YbaK/EbsC family protein [Nesterenkonia xinjiangensis]NYJ78862.1 Cys-tRNA(Pro) deacylase [Nesterenkonia xinjiangensis]
METTPDPAATAGLAAGGPADAILSEEDRASVERLLRDADAHGVQLRFIRRGQANSLQEAAAAVGVEPREIVKTLVARAKVTQTTKEHSYVLALIPGDRQVDWAKLRRLAGMKKMSMTAPEEAVEATGHRPGTITPFGAESAEGVRWPIYADESITGRIAMGAGAAGLSLFVDSAALFAAYDVVTADITRTAPPG